MRSFYKALIAIEHKLEMLIFKINIMQFLGLFHSVEHYIQEPVRVAKCSVAITKDPIMIRQSSQQIFHIQQPNKPSDVLECLLLLVSMGETHISLVTPKPFSFC